MFAKFDNWELAILKYYIYVTTKIHVNAHNLIPIHNLKKFVEEHLMMEKETDSDNWRDKEACKKEMME